MLNGDYPSHYRGDLILYIGNIGTIELDYEALGNQVIEAISIPQL